MNLLFRGIFDFEAKDMHKFVTIVTITFLV